MDHTPEQLVAMGYRRTSRKYGMVSRIDRPDWVQVLARHLRRAPADFYVPGENEVQGNWCDYYRCVLSKDTLEIGPVLALRVPTSGHDPVGYVDVIEGSVARPMLAVA
jgi:hypothetical protein